MTWKNKLKATFWNLLFSNSVLHQIYTITQNYTRLHLPFVLQLCTLFLHVINRFCCTILRVTTKKLMHFNFTDSDDSVKRCHVAPQKIPSHSLNFEYFSLTIFQCLIIKCNFVYQKNVGPVFSGIYYSHNPSTTCSAYFQSHAQYPPRTTLLIMYPPFWHTLCDDDAKISK